MSTKQCTKCHETKSLIAFRLKRNRVIAEPSCRTCESRAASVRLKSNAAGHRAAQKRYEKAVAKMPLKVSRDRRKRIAKFGITHDDYQHMLASQGGCCAICQATRADRGKKNLAIDHCHRTGTVRGLLCTSCNVALGMLREDPERMRKMAAYINHWAKLCGPESNR